MPGVIGTVRSIDRSNGWVNWVQDGERISKNAQYLGDPPPPLTRCEFTPVSSGKYICRGALCNTRQLIHDDFLTVPAPGWGDTWWRNILNGGVGAINQVANTGAGVVSVQPNAAAALMLTKDSGACAPPVAPAAYWFSAFIAQPQLAGTDMVVGLIDDTTNNFVAVRPHAPGIYALDVRTALVDTILNTPTVSVANIFVAIDIIFTSSFAALWVTGDGPYVLTTGLPTVALQPAVYCSQTSGTPQAWVDWIHVEKVDAVIDQTRLTSLLAGLPVT